MTTNGSGRRYEVSPIGTCRSCMASSSADCTFAGARLISSARTRLAKIGPKRGVNVWFAGLRICVPVTSAGRRSGVNWMRWNVASMAPASVFASSVLAKPGRPSSRTWPRMRRAMTRRSTTASCPTTARATSARSLAITSCAAAICAAAALESIVVISEHRVDFRPQLGIGDGAHHAVDDLAVLQDQEGRERHHRLAHGQLLLFLRVDGADAETAGVIGGDALHDGEHGLAGGAPFGAEVDEGHTAGGGRRKFVRGQFFHGAQS